MAFYFGDSIHQFVNIKVKERHDSIFDQIPRIFVCKLFILSAMIMSITWFNDEARCIPPKGDANRLPAYFIHRACWLKGIYVYPQLHQETEYDVSYYGVPTALEKDGVLEDKEDELCKVGWRNENCKPMEREYFHQYKWIPFYVAFLAFLFFYPYMIFKICNSDFINLKNNLGNHEVSADQIVDAFFNNTDSVRKRRNHLRILGNYIVKLLYFFNGVIGFFIIDHLTHNRFNNLGNEWTSYSKEIRFDVDESLLATPANKFLPVFGICELMDVRADSTHSRADKVRVVCEISTQIMYQYCFILYWFVLIFSMCCSALGIIIYICKHLILLFGRTKKGPGHIHNQYLSLRQVEYLDIIRRRHLPMYTTIRKMLNERALQDVWRENSGMPINGSMPVNNAESPKLTTMYKFHAVSSMEAI
ncbi:innexin inx4-like [Clytia hemisphaerica]|uniref:Innexin n=1 Tax=Clytia hemisphaerica TaxID=252671 RepID=A0A7M5U840_9CNID